MCGDRESVIDTIQLLAQLALDLPRVAEIETNPLVVLREGAYAVDVRVRVTESAEHEQAKGRRN